MESALLGSYYNCFVVTYDVWMLVLFSSADNLSQSLT